MKIKKHDKIKVEEIKKKYSNRYIICEEHRGDIIEIKLLDKDGNEIDPILADILERLATIEKKLQNIGI